MNTDTKYTILILALLLTFLGNVARAGCERIKDEDDYRSMQEEIMESDPAADVNQVMHQRIDFCSGRCGTKYDTPETGICIMKPTKKKTSKK